MLIPREPMCRLGSRDPERRFFVWEQRGNGHRMDTTTGGIRIHRPPDQLLDLGKWFPLANAYIDHLLASLGPTDFAVLIAVKRQIHGFRRSRARVSQREVMALTGLSRRTVRRSLARLVSAGHLIILEAGIGRRSTDYRINEDLVLAVGNADSRGVSVTPLESEDVVEGSEVSPRGVASTPQTGQDDASTRTSKDNSKDREKDNSLSDSISSLSQQLIDSWPAIQRELLAQCGTRAAYNTYLDGLTPEPTGNGQIILRGHRPYETAFADFRLRPWILRALRAVITEPFEDDALVILGPAQPAESLRLTPANDRV